MSQTGTWLEGGKENDKPWDKGGIDFLTAFIDGFVGAPQKQKSHEPGSLTDASVEKSRAPTQGPLSVPLPLDKTALHQDKREHTSIIEQSKYARRSSDTTAVRFVMQRGLDNQTNSANSANSPRNSMGSSYSLSHINDMHGLSPRGVYTASPESHTKYSLNINAERSAGLARPLSPRYQESMSYSPRFQESLSPRSPSFAQHQIHSSSRGIHSSVPDSFPYGGVNSPRGQLPFAGPMFRDHHTQADAVPPVLMHIGTAEDERFLDNRRIIQRQQGASLLHPNPIIAPPLPILESSLHSPASLPVHYAGVPPLALYASDANMHGQLARPTSAASSNDSERIRLQIVQQQKTGDETPGSPASERSESHGLVMARRIADRDAKILALEKALEQKSAKSFESFVNAQHHSEMQARIQALEKALAEKEGMLQKVTSGSLTDAQKGAERDAKISSLEAALAERNNNKEVKEIEATLQKAQSEIELLKQERDNISKKYTAQVADLEKKLNSMADTTRVPSNNSSNNSSNVDTNPDAKVVSNGSELNELREWKQESHKQIQSLEEELGLMKEAMRSTYKRVVELNEEVENLRGQNLSKASQVYQLEGELIKLKEESAAKGAQQEELEKEMSKLKGLNGTRGDTDGFKVEDILRELKELSSAKEELKRVDELKKELSELREAQQSMNNLREVNRVSLRRVSVLEKELRELNEITESFKRVAELEGQVKELNLAKSAGLKRATDLEEELEKVRSDFKRVSAEKKKARDEVEGWCAKVQKSENEVLRLQSLLKACDVHAIIHERTVQDVQRLGLEVLQEVTATVKELGKVTDNVADSNKVAEAMGALLQTNAVRIHDMDQELKSLSQQLADAQENEKLQQRLAMQMQKAAEEANASYKALQDAVADKRADGPPTDVETENREPIKQFFD